jgi:phage terminase large subunit
LRHVPKPIKQGYFIYDEENARHNIMSDIKWVNDKKGCIKLFKLPNMPAFTQYCIGGDTAGDTKGDEFSSDVVDARSLEQVATLTMQTDEDLYAKQMYCLGKYYGDALIGIEANFDSYPIMELQRIGYLKQYTREAVDTYTGKTEKRFGFKTTSLTRPTIISRLIEIVREHCNLLNDNATLEELLTIIRNEKGRIEAPQGGHDDMMMGLAIAHHIREQVVFSNEPIVPQNQYQFDFQRQAAKQYDYGETITII